jgi:hypothetical protein
MKRKSILIILMGILLALSFVSSGTAYGYNVLVKAVWSEHVSYDTNYFCLGENTYIMGGINLDDPSISTATVKWDSTTIGLPLVNFLNNVALYIKALGSVPPTSFGDWENKTYTFEIDGFEVGNVFITPGTLRELSIPVATYNDDTKTVSWQSVEFAGMYQVRILRSTNVDDFLFSSKRLEPDETQYTFDQPYHSLLDNGAIIAVEAREFVDDSLANTSIYVTRTFPPPDLSGCIRLKGEPLIRAEILLFGSGAGRPQWTNTDTNGCYEFDEIASEKRLQIIIRNSNVPE